MSFKKRRLFRFCFINASETHRQQNIIKTKQAGRKDLFYLTTLLDTFLFVFIVVVDIVKDHRDNEMGNLKAATVSMTGKKRVRE